MRDDTEHLRGVGESWGSGDGGLGGAGPHDGQTVDALASRAEEGRDQATKRLGEPRVGTDPRVSEWGNPVRVIPDDPRLNP